MPFRDYITAPHKLVYIEGKDRHEIPCLFCAIIEGNPRVKTKIVYHDDDVMTKV